MRWMTDLALAAAAIALLAAAVWISSHKPIDYGAQGRMIIFRQW